MVRPRPRILFRSGMHQRRPPARQPSGWTCGAPSGGSPDEPRVRGCQSADGSCTHTASRMTLDSAGLTPRPAGMHPVTVSSRSATVDATNGCTSGTAPQTIIAARLLTTAGLTLS
jgi:hypothetical protein